MSYNFNLATWGSDLNCMKDCKFPVSYSLQSVTMKPPEKDAGGLVSLTLRTPGEIRYALRRKYGFSDFPCLILYSYINFETINCDSYGFG